MKSVVVLVVVLSVVASVLILGSVGLVFVSAVELDAPQTLANGCLWTCKWASFQCCKPGFGVLNHYAKADAVDTSAECWAHCQEPTPVDAIVRESRPDFVVTGIEARVTSGMFFVDATIQNAGVSWDQEWWEDRQFRVEQSIEELPLRVGDVRGQRARNAFDWYNVRFSGPLLSGETTSLIRAGAHVFPLLFDYWYLYRIRVNPSGAVPEQSLENNEFVAHIRLRWDGTLEVRQMM